MLKKISAIILLASSAVYAEDCQYFPSVDQDVNLYDGTLGVSNAFVKAHSKHAVGLIAGTVGAGCSGTLLPGNLVLTAGHCIGTNFSGTNVTFNYQVNGSNVMEVQENFPVVELLERQVKNPDWTGYDYAVIKIGPNSSGIYASSKYPVARISDYFNPQSNSIFTSIGHSGGRPKKIDTGVYYGQPTPEGWVEYSGMNIMGGSSGGGILNSDGYVTSLALAISCSTSVGTLGGGHTVRELLRFSPALRSLYATYKNDWSNRHLNDFSQGIRWANIGSSNWVLNTSSQKVEFKVNNPTLSGAKAEKRASLVTHPFIVHASGSKKVNFATFVSGGGLPARIEVYVQQGNNRTYLTSVNTSASQELDLSAFSGAVHLEFEAIAPSAPSGTAQVVTITLDNVTVPDFSPVLAPIVGKNNYITSAWTSGAGLYAQSASVAQSGSYVPSSQNSHWQFKVIGGQYVKITNRLYPSQSLHMANGVLALGSISDSSTGAQWILEPAPGYAAATLKAYRIKNLQTNKYLNIENGVLQATDLEEGSWSSYWNITNI